MQQSGELVHAMLKDAGFNVVLEILPGPVMLEKQNKGDYNIDSTANSYRLDPDGWYGRNILSTAPETRRRNGYKNEKADQIILAARKEGDRAKRRQMYADVETLVNRDLPMLYTHFVPLMMASNKAKVKGYNVSYSGPWSYTGAGMRRTWIEG
jgi:peptide/nickel transport system substrate-binding protein